MYLRVYHRIFVYGCLNSNSKSHRLCVLTCADVISITLQYAVHDKPLALQLHLWFAHREADLQLQAILCITEGGAMAEVPATGVKTLLSNFLPY